MSTIRKQSDDQENELEQGVTPADATKRVDTNKIWRNDSLCDIFMLSVIYIYCICVGVGESEGDQQKSINKWN